MTLRNILKYAILYLGYSEQIDIDDKQITAENTPEIKKLVRCANLVYEELLTDYFPALKHEKIKFTNGFVPYSELSEKIIDIYGLYNNGEVNYTTDIFGIYSDVSEAEITYSYMLSDLTLESEVTVDSRITAKLFSLGICAEYCLINNLFNESIAFDRRYKDGLKNLTRKKTEIVVKPRRWY